MQVDVHHNAILQLQSGDPKGLEKLYDDYSPALYGICCNILKDEADASDALQDAFVKIWKYAKSYNSEKGSLFTWMLNITRNVAIDKLRKLSGGKNISFEPIQKTGSPVYEIHSASGDQQQTDTIGLKALLGNIPEEQQQVVDYLYFRGYTQAEMSEELDIPLGTVKSRSRSALKSLKKLFSLIIGWMLNSI